MKKKILISYKIPREGLLKLDKYYDITYPENTHFSREELLEKIPDHQGLLSIFNQHIDHKIIEAGTQLEIISNYGVGTNNIDIEAATNNGIAVCNTPQSVCEPTAELCFGLMLSLTRRITECDRKLRNNPDFKWGVMNNLGHSLQRKTLGIIGMGKIGKSVAKKGLAFGMQIVYHNRSPLPKSEEQLFQAHYLEMDELLRNADIISLHCPLTPGTHHLIGERELTMMKEEAFLINTSRGAVVDEEALVQALQKNNIAGAGLDVFEKEPHIHSKLKELPNTVLVPHMGTATEETRIEMAKEASLNFISFWEDKKAKNQVNTTFTNPPK